MALTMTRTRTQTALTKLAELVANVHGELEFVEGWLANEPGVLEPQARLGERRLQLVRDRDALYATLRQFDGQIAPERIGSLEGWRKRFGRPCKIGTFRLRFIAGLPGQST